MSDRTETVRSIAAMQLAQWLLQRLVNDGVIPRDEAISWLKQAIETNFKGNYDNVAVAKIFDQLLLAIEGTPKQDV